MKADIKGIILKFINNDKNNRRKIFGELSFAIRHSVNELLKNDSVDFAKNPKVNVVKLLETRGYKITEEVFEEAGDGKNKKHAKLDTVNKIITLNESDSDEEKRFSLAHEFGHIIFEIQEDNAVESIAHQLVARESSTENSLVLYDICEKRIDSKKPIYEEVMDYFAANLLLPIERFFFWSDKTAGEIAKAFGVNEKCVAKRIDEIRHSVRLIPVPPSKVDPGSVIMTQEEISSALLAF
jgi:Zn-dependent peptidase ImmA (M78 family)